MGKRMFWTGPKADLASSTAQSTRTPRKASKTRPIRSRQTKYLCIRVKQVEPILTCCSLNHAGEALVSTIALMEQIR
jgi:hypothetical protein